MKFEYQFKQGDKIRLKGRPDSEVYTIKSRYGGLDEPAYRCIEISDIIPEQYCSLAEEASSTYDIEDKYRVYLAKRDESVSTLSQFARNLNLLALNKKLAPVYNREQEMETIKTILLRRMTPNPLLTGAAGCGKTAIVEGVAQSFVDEILGGGSFHNVPVIYDLSLSALLSGTKYRGDFEDRLTKIVNNIKLFPNVIIFIDEIHLLNNTGNAEGAISAGQQLKPALARGEFRCIGATTEEEYEKYVATDKALARRFSLVKVHPLVGSAQANCIKNIIKEYGEYFQIDTSEVTVDTLQMIIKDIIPDTIFPNNVINIIDEALAVAKYNKVTEITDTEIKRAAGRQYNIFID